MCGLILLYWKVVSSTATSNLIILLFSSRAQHCNVVDWIRSSHFECKGQLSAIRVCSKMFFQSLNNAVLIRLVCFKVTDSLTTVKSINKTDAITLLSTFSVSTATGNIHLQIDAIKQNSLYAQTYPQWWWIFAYFIVCRGNHQCLQRGLGSLSRSWATKSETKYTSLYECTEGRGNISLMTMLTFCVCRQRDSMMCCISPSSSPRQKTAETSYQGCVKSHPWSSSSCEIAC